MNANEWRHECNYIAGLADARGMVPEMDNSVLVCIHYAHIMQNKAKREGFHDVVEYIEHCIDDMKGANE